MKVSRPILILAILAILSALYLAWRDRTEDNTVQVAIRRPVTPAPAQRGGPAGEDQGATPAQPVEINLFGPQTWAPPPPPPPPPPTPEQIAEEIRRNPPRPPPLPFQVVSIWRQSGTTYIGITANGQDVIVCQKCTLPGSIRRGDTLLHNYRLDQISDRSLVFTFLPLKIKQELPIGDMP
ncbi:hypothetical protein WKW79_12725 [Variovorax robiniae]|uniref:Secretion system X translation initiation factor n=1 Tax=Variovorax robiniae TaxID=1836199 RepID=A0ABU8X9U1_9BURK